MRWINGPSWSLPWQERRSKPHSTMPTGSSPSIAQRLEAMRATMRERWQGFVDRVRGGKDRFERTQQQVVTIKDKVSNAKETAVSTVQNVTETAERMASFIGVMATLGLITPEQVQTLQSHVNSVKPMEVYKRFRVEQHLKNIAAKAPISKKVNVAQVAKVVNTII